MRPLHFPGFTSFPLRSYLEFLFIFLNNKFEVFLRARPKKAWLVDVGGKKKGQPEMGPGGGGGKREL